MIARPCSMGIALLLLMQLASMARGQVGDERIRVPTGPIEIEADQVVYHREENLYEARGDVQITMGVVRIRADEVEYYPDTAMAEARGDVELTDGEDVLRCETMQVNLETQTGEVDHARLITRENFHITGKRIEKLGPKTYRIHEGSFTTCSGDSPDWIFKAKRIDLTIEGYAVARHPFFKAKGIPVAYLPIGVYPVKTKRQTGFLIPDLGYSGEFGPEVNLPFFWAIDQDKDATIYLNWLGKRGLKEGGEFRYALSRDTEGKANFYYIDDRETEEGRWAFLFRHHQRGLPLGSYARGDVNLVSDNDYVFDFEEDFPDRALIDVRSDRQLESVFFGGRVWPEYNLVGEFSYFDNLTVEDNDGTLQRLPEVTLSGFDQPLLGTRVYGGGELTYTNFWRLEGVRGSRLDLFPRISMPFRPLNWLKFLPAAGLRETLYWPEQGVPGQNEFETRTLPWLEAMLSTTASRVWETPSLEWQKLKHSIQPEVRYTYIPRVDQRDLPIFDGTDRIPFTSEITYGLTSFVDGRTGATPGSGIRRLLQLELSQSYSLGDSFFPGEDFPERKFSNIRGELTLSPFSYFNLESDAEYSLIRDRIVLFNTLASVNDSRGDSLVLDYRFSKDELEQINLYSQIRLWEWADLFVSYRYDLLNDLRVESRTGLTYRAQCWNVTFSVEDRNRSFDRSREAEVKFNISISLVGLGSLGTAD